ncbi:MAG: ABC transporter permease, partial [Phycisphaerales bacterium]|nr:ABC transporter permease [Phycisphaerales bacterium]
IRVGREAHIPVYSADTDSVERGTVAALGFDYYDVGRQTGQLVVRVLRGENPGEMAVERIKTLKLFLNPGAAARMGVVIPEAVRQRAAHVVEP